MQQVTEAELRELLSLEHIAIVGRVGEPDSDASTAVSSLRTEGYDVVPIPTNEQTAADRLDEIDRQIDIVVVYDWDVSVESIVDAATTRSDVSVFWTQPETDDETVLRQARAGGLLVVENRDICVDHRRVYG